MKVTATAFPGVVLIEPEVFADARGHLLETFQARRYAELGIPAAFVQDLLSHSL